MNTNAAGIIFSNVHDEELHEITRVRTMGSLPFGGKYRLIDFGISNLKNSGITNIGIITKSNYQSLIDHLKSGKDWDLSRKRGGLFLFPPFGRINSGFYRNKIEALYGIMPFIKKTPHDYILISDCDVICNIDWNLPLDFHIRKQADITVIYYEKEPESDGSGKNTIYSINSEGNITDILINQQVTIKSTIGTNMWIIGRSFLETVIEDAIAHNYDNFERDIMQKRLNICKMAGWKFKGYLKKINSITDYFQTNMDVLKPDIRNELFQINRMILTKESDDIPAKYGPEASVSNSLIANGCNIEGKVENSILFRGVQVGKNSKITNSIIMQGSHIGENVTLEYIIADKNVTFQDNRKLIGYITNPLYIKKDSNL